MKIVFEKDVLLGAIIPAMSAVSNKHDNPATEGIRLMTTDEHHCRISAFDTEKGFEAEIEADVREPGCYIINANKLLSIVRVMPDDVTIQVDEQLHVVISSSRSRFELFALEGKLFPTLPELRGERAFRIKQNLLREMFSETMFAIAENNQKRELNGAFVTITDKNIKMVALDGFRFAMRETQCEIESLCMEGVSPELQIIIPKKSIVEIMRFISDTEEPVLVTMGVRHLIFDIDGVKFFCRQIDGTYLDYERFIPKNTTLHVDVSARELKDSLERALLVTEDKEAGKLKSHVKLIFDGNILKITSTSNNNRIYEEIPITSEGDYLEIGFNCRLILDCFRAIPEENVKLHLTSALSCMVIEPEDPADHSFLYFVFPIRMREDLQ